MQTFFHREKKRVKPSSLQYYQWLFNYPKLISNGSRDLVLLVLQLPSFIDWFGWCTWDAFYTDVTAEGVEEGLKR